MIENFITVGGQVLILFVLVIVGYVLGKTNVITEKGGKVCSDLALLIATPCVIVMSLQREYSPQVLKNLLIALLAAFGVHAVAVVISLLVYRKDNPTTRVYRASAVMSNAGFMGLPLQQAVLGDEGVLYGAAFVVLMNITLWSYGIILMDKRGQKLSVKRMLFTPGMIGVAVGLLLFVCRITLPDLIGTPVRHLAALNTPLPMLFAGYYLSRIDIGKALRSRAIYGGVLMRLIVVPIICIAAIYLCGVRGTLLVSMAIAATAPTAVSVSMFADRYQQDTETAVNLVAIGTVFSVVTMPLLVAVAQLIA
ncbi:MAG: AEC family transporter [Clostridia bacterium]|nr:AEC family transporter [Clostridia bacterium]